jgi:hypothetical protein
VELLRTNLSKRGYSDAVQKLLAAADATGVTLYQANARAARASEGGDRDITPWSATGCFWGGQGRSDHGAFVAALLFARFAVAAGDAFVLKNGVLGQGRGFGFGLGFRFGIGGFLLVELEAALELGFE